MVRAAAFRCNTRKNGVSFLFPKCDLQQKKWIQFVKTTRTARYLRTHCQHVITVPAYTLSLALYVSLICSTCTHTLSLCHCSTCMHSVTAVPARRTSCTSHSCSHVHLPSTATEQPQVFVHSLHGPKIGK